MRRVAATSRWSAVVCALALTASPGAVAQPKAGPPELDLADGTASTNAPDGGTYARAFAELMLGKGARLNDPFRLGGATAAYLDLGLGAAFGPPLGLQHGGEVSLSVALDGIAQEVLSLSYVALYPIEPSLLLRGRAGVPIILEPDANVGLELGAGGVFFVTGGLGISAEVVGSLFYGAATEGDDASSFPIVSFELGAFFDHEVLP